MTTYAEPTTQLPAGAGLHPGVPPQPMPQPKPHPYPAPEMSHQAAPAAQAGSAAPFSVSLRGYDREQVDHHVRGLHGQMTELREALRGEYYRSETLSTELDQAQLVQQREQERAEAAEARLDRLEEALQLEQQRTEAAETEVALLRARLEAQAGELARLGDFPVGGGYGYRMEKLIRAAEQEAAQERTAAAEEAAAMIEQARTDAGSYLHEAERALLDRAAALEEQIAERNAALERDITERRAALEERERELARGAHAESARILEATTLRADAILTEARARADHERWQAEQGIARRRAEIGGELNRLVTLRETIRGELSRLLTSLMAEFESSVARIPTQERTWTPHVAPVPPHATQAVPVTPHVAPFPAHRRAARPDPGEIGFLFRGNQSA